MAGDPRSLAEHDRRVVEYYTGSWLDYRMLWTERRAAAMHFGYEAPGVRSHRDSVIACNRAMADAVGLRHGERVLDAGCGVGGTAVWLADNYAAEVTGVNIVPSYVARARRNARRCRGAPPCFVVADYTAIPLADASVDVVWAQESACHTPNKPALLGEAARVLAPGGRIVLAEYVLTSDTPSVAVDAWCRSWEMSLSTQAEWAAALDDAGFRDVVFHDVTSRMRRSLRRLARLCASCKWGADVLHAVGLRSAAQQRNLRGGLAMWEALGAGSWYYAFLTAALPQGPAETDAGEALTV